ncbi:hypothetical protein [Vibrio sp. B1FLJ16]|uniref:hypothetical protein n=1 Tax=Vibrio sp. B1FLJ16 TaxID=2751178 RepID=UPI001FD290BD|nr:hypothetical protein [Vibrio sp. B1FLJ16]
MACRMDWGFSYQLCGVKQEQDLFLCFSIKKAIDSLEKVAIVPILVMPTFQMRCSYRVFLKK